MRRARRTVDGCCANVRVRDIVAWAMDSDRYRHLVSLLSELATDAVDLSLLLRHDGRIGWEFFGGLPMPETSSFNGYTAKVVERLNAFNLVDRAFLRALVAARPLQRARVSRVELALGLQPEVRRTTVCLLCAAEERALAAGMRAALAAALERVADVVCRSLEASELPDPGGFASATYVVELRRGVSQSPAPPAWLAALARRDVVVLGAEEIECLIDLLTEEFVEVPRARHMGASPLTGLSRRDVRRIVCQCLDVVAWREFLVGAEVDERSLGGEGFPMQVFGLLHSGNDAAVAQLLDFLWEECRGCVQQRLSALRELS